MLTDVSKERNACLGVFSLSSHITECDLRRVFSKYGPLSDVCMVTHPVSKQPRDFAFVYFEKREDAVKVPADEF